MKKPKPIVVRTPGIHLELKCVGFRSKDSRPYLSFDSDRPGVHGYIEDRDIKRLKAWCEDALRKRK